MFGFTGKNTDSYEGNEPDIPLSSENHVNDSKNQSQSVVFRRIECPKNSRLNTSYLHSIGYPGPITHFAVHNIALGIEIDTFM